MILPDHVRLIFFPSFLNDLPFVFPHPSSPQLFCTNFDDSLFLVTADIRKRFGSAFTPTKETSMVALCLIYPQSLFITTTLLKVS